MNRSPCALVVGGCGYIGAHACKALDEGGYQVVNLDNLSRGHREFARWGTFYEGDCGDLGLLDEILHRHRPHVVLHFAALAYVGESVTLPLTYYENNLAKPIALLQKLIAGGVSKFIFSSTCATYGENQASGGLIDETHTQSPINPYGRSKLFFEHVLADAAAAHNFRYLAFRYFNAAGADESGQIGEWHEPETHLIPLALRAALGEGPKLTVYGNDYPTARKDGTAVRDYVHVNDLVDAHILGIGHLDNIRGGDAFNLGNGNGFTVLEVIETIRAVTGLDVPFEIGPRRPGDPSVLIGSAGKARRILGWQPKRPELQTIVETAYKWELQVQRLRRRGTVPPGSPETAATP